MGASELKVSTRKMDATKSSAVIHSIKSVLQKLQSDMDAAPATPEKKKGPRAAMSEDQELSEFMSQLEGLFAASTQDEISMDAIADAVQEEFPRWSVLLKTLDG